MRSRLPAMVIALALVGLIPFIGLGIGTLSAHDDAEATRWLAALLGWGAVMLAFFGGAHWGFVLGAPPVEPPAAAPHARARLALGGAPAVLGWVALLAAMLLFYDLALVLLIVGFAAAVLAEARFQRNNLLPSGYMWLRWAFSLVAVVCLVTTLALRLINAKIIF